MTSVLAAACAALLAAGPLAAAGFERAEEDAFRQAEIMRLYRRYEKGFGEVRSISPFEAWERSERGEKILFVDARGRKEWEVSRIPGAVTKKEFERDRDKYLGWIVVPYCTVGARSGRYARKILGTGVDARNMAGSILLWAHQIGTLTDEKGPTRRVHVYGRRWTNLAPMAFEEVR